MASYDLTALSTALEFDTTNADYKSVVKLPGIDRIVIGWRQSTTVILLQAFNVNTGTGAITAIGSPLDIESGTASGNGITVTCIDASNIAAFWTGPAGDGFAQLFSLDGTGNISANGSAIEFDTTDGDNMASVLMDATHILAVWTGSTGDGFACIFTVTTGTGTISKTGTQFAFDTNNFGGGDLKKLSATKALVFYQGNGGTGFAVVLDINTSTWAVTAAGSALDTGVTNARSFAIAVMDSASSPMQVVLGYTSSDDSDATVRSYNINTSTWAITAFGSALDLSTTGADAFFGITLQQYDGTHFVAWYQGADGDGFGRTLTFNTGTGAITTSANQIEFDTADFFQTWSCAMEEDVGMYVVSWSGSGSDGFVQAFQVTAPTPSGPANLKSYNTNLKANIKTINTNAIANVKTLDTNA